MGQTGSGRLVGDPGTVVGDREHDIPVPTFELDAHRVAAVLERVSRLGSLKTSASAVAWSPASDTGSSAVSTRLPRRPEPLNEHALQPVEQFVEVDVVVAALRQHLVDGCDREDPVRGVIERLARINLFARPGLESRSSEATVWRSCS